MTQSPAIYGVRFRVLSCRRCHYRWIWKNATPPTHCPNPRCHALHFGLKMPKPKARKDVIEVAGS